MSNSPIVASEASESSDSWIVGLELSKWNCRNNQIGWPELPPAFKYSFPCHFCITKAAKISYLKLLMMYAWNKTEMQEKSIHQSSRKVKMRRGSKARDSRRMS
jgi:hypothetical protein